MKTITRIIVMMCITVGLISCDGKKDLSNHENLNVYLNKIDTLVSIEPTILSLGSIEPKSKNKVSFEFSMSNHHDSIIHINNVDVSCNCVTITSYPSLISPGETGDIKGFLNLKNQHGHLRKTIFVKYNNECIKTIKITADIKK